VDLWQSAEATVNGGQEVLRFCRGIPAWYLGIGPRPIGVLPDTPDKIKTGAVSEKTLSNLRRINPRLGHNIEDLD
jgi:hypothetical protein